MARDLAGAPARLGFIGLGAMGGPMARNLLAAGYALAAFDIDPERLAACVEAGAVGCGSSGEVVGRSDVVLTSLRSSAIFVEVGSSDTRISASNDEPAGWASPSSTGRTVSRSRQTSIAL